MDEKKMIQAISLYKRQTVDSKPQITWKKKNGKIHEQWKRSKVAILILHKIDFKTKIVIRAKKKRYIIMIKGLICHEDITINIYAPKNRALN